MMLRLYVKSYNVFDCMSYSTYATFIMRYVRIPFVYGGIFTSVFEVVLVCVFSCITVWFVLHYVLSLIVRDERLFSAGDVMQLICYARLLLYLLKCCRGSWSTYVKTSQVYFLRVIVDHVLSPTIYWRMHLSCVVWQVYPTLRPRLFYLHEQWQVNLCQSRTLYNPSFLPRDAL